MPKSSKPEDEYKLPDEEVPLIEPPEEPKRPKWKTLLLNRRFIAILVVIVAVFVVYQFLGDSTTTKKELAEIKPSATPAVITPTQPMPSIASAPTGTLAPVVPGPETAAASDTLSQQLAQNQMQMQQLQINLQQMQNTVAQLSNQVATLGATPPSCAALSQCGGVKAVPVVRPKPRAAARPIPPHYTVRAVVPGRAWLQQSRNSHTVKLVTVRVGDYLAGYGRVQAISATQGKVWTSWGSIISYGPNDR